MRYRYAGIPRKHTLGQYPAIDLKSARSLASKGLQDEVEAWHVPVANFPSVTSRFDGFDCPDCECLRHLVSPRVTYG